MGFITTVASASKDQHFSHWLNIIDALHADHVRTARSRISYRSSIDLVTRWRRRSAKRARPEDDHRPTISCRSVGGGGRSEAEAIEYREQVDAFLQPDPANQIKMISPLASRGWCYLLERHGLRKGDFDAAEKLITDAASPATAARHLRRG